MKSNMYTDGEYAIKNTSWHQQDSAWKAGLILEMIHRNRLDFRSVCEVGCGAGQILKHLCSQLPEHIYFDGFDISPQAYAIAKQCEEERLRFHLEDFLSARGDCFDILLLIDVFEHVPDYIGFIQGCSPRAKYKIYHIPLDISVNSVLRFSLINTRSSVGHLHYFTADTALATVRDSGQRVLDFCYTDAVVARCSAHPSIRRNLGNVMRHAMSAVSARMAAQLLGGYSLLVLAE